MGKGRKNDKPSKNVFKVAGSQGFKAKNKAKTVTTQLKKLSQVNRRKTDDVDRQFNQLQGQVRQQDRARADDKTADKNPAPTKLINNDVQQFEQSQKRSIEALQKLTDMSMA